MIAPKYLRICLLEILILTISSYSIHCQSANTASLDSANDKTALTGCILGQDGKYVLITDKQSSTIQLISSASLKPHVGQKVKLTGTMSNASPRPNTSGNGSRTVAINNSDPKVPPNDDASAAGTLWVTQLKVISNKCSTKPVKKEKSWTNILAP